jgi:hypothetical protein
MSKTQIARKPRYSAVSNVAEVFVLDWEQEETCHGLILDVAEGGACFRSGMKLPVESTVELRIEIEGQVFELLANVRWSRGSDGIYEAGMMFLPGETGQDGELGRQIVEALAER